MSSLPPDGSTENIDLGTPAGVAIRVRGLTKRFGDFTAVDNLDLEIGRGEIFGCLGPNGSGKTTTIRMMLGLLSPTSGEVDLMGVPLARLGRSIRHRIGYMSQRFSLYNDLSVRQNLQFYGKAYGLKGQQLEDQIAVSVEMAGLTGKERAKTGELSGGWRQRLALAAAIIHKPEIVFLDEPTAGVDPVSRRAFWDLLYRLVAEQITVFVTTHYMDEAEHCHRLAFMRRGRRIAYGAPSDIKHSMFSGQILELSPTDAPAAVRVLRAARVRENLPLTTVELYGEQVHVTAPNIRKVLRAIAAELHRNGIKIDHGSLIEPTLEDVFIASMRLQDEKTNAAL